MEWGWLWLVLFWCYGCSILYYSLREYSRERRKQRDEGARIALFVERHRRDMYYIWRHVSATDGGYWYLEAHSFMEWR